MGDYSLGAHASGLRDLMTCLGIERATIVGQSLGGGVALQLGLPAPRAVRAAGAGVERRPAAARSAGCCACSRCPGSELVLPIAVPGRRPRPRATPVSTVDPRPRASARARIAEMWRAYASLAEPENRQAFVRDAAGRRRPGRPDRRAPPTASTWPRPCPPCIVWGDHDAIIPVEHAYAAHEAMPGSRLEIFPGIGHFPQTEAPERLVEVLADFIATTAPAEARLEELQHLLVEGAVRALTTGRCASRLGAEPRRSAAAGRPGRRCSSGSSRRGTRRCRRAPCARPSRAGSRARPRRP